MKKCNGLAGVLFGHNYQARYSTGEPVRVNVSGEGCDAPFFLRALEVSKSKTYVHDVCTRCGDIAGKARGEAS